MTSVRCVATHDVVRATYPRPVTERDEIGMAAGKAIDHALSQFSHEHRSGRRPTLAWVDRIASETLDEELEVAMLRLTPEQRSAQLRQISGVLRAFRSSELMGLERPRTRMILIDGAFGVYAQPDYWDGRDRFFEMKSYHADPIPPDVTLQIELFQLAFPGFRAYLAEFDRHADPVTRAVREMPPVEPAEQDRVLAAAKNVAASTGQAKVLEYIENPIVRYSLASATDP